MVTCLILPSIDLSDLSSGSGRSSFIRAMRRLDLFLSVRRFIAGRIQ